MENLLSNIKSDNLPKHIAIIMDGNGRWAQKRGNFRIFGHKMAVEAVRDTIEASAEIGIKFVTLFAFSTENWKRPQREVNALMELLVNTIKKETPVLMKNKIRLKAIGEIESLPLPCQKNLREAVDVTKNNVHMTLTLALSYGARRDLTSAIQKISEKVKTGEINSVDIDESCISSHLSSNFMPDPELIIRTSGEARISNFLLWEIAYSEIVFCDTLWPDFRRKDLFSAIIDYQNRERRFGKTSEQIKV